MEDWPPPTPDPHLNTGSGRPPQGLGPSNPQQVLEQDSGPEVRQCIASAMTVSKAARRQQTGNLEGGAGAWRSCGRRCRSETDKVPWH